MKLSEMKAVVPVAIVRQGTFASVGLVTHTKADMLAFLESPRYLDGLLNNKSISCVLTTESLVDSLPSGVGVAASSDPRRHFYEFHNYLAQRTSFYWQDFPASIASDAIVHPGARIADANVRVGHRTVVEPGAIVLPHCTIGDDVILRAGCVIGTQGFEFKRFPDRILPVAHAGGVHLHDRVEVQANSAISRSIFGDLTELGEDTKLDNLVHIAHNVSIGKRCLLAACAMVAGSVTLGDDVWVGPGACISSEIRIGDGASITIGSVVTRDVAPGQRVSGNFAIDHERFIAFIKSIR